MKLIDNKRNWIVLTASISLVLIAFILAWFKLTLPQASANICWLVVNDVTVRFNGTLTQNALVTITDTNLWASMTWMTNWSWLALFVMDNLSAVSCPMALDNISVSASYAWSSTWITYSYNWADKSISLDIIQAPKILANISVTSSANNFYSWSKMQMLAIWYDQSWAVISPAPNFIWTSDNPSVMNVTQTWLVTWISAWTWNITASSWAITWFKTLTVDPPFVPLLSNISLSPSNTSVAVGWAVQFVMSAFNQSWALMNPSPSVTWTSSNTWILTVNATWRAVWVGVWTWTITATWTWWVFGTATVRVNPVFSQVLTTIVINSSTWQIASWATLPLTTTLYDQSWSIMNPSPTITWSSDNNQVITVSSTWVLTWISAWTWNITASWTWGATSSKLMTVYWPIPPAINYWAPATTMVSQPTTFAASWTSLNFWSNIIFSLSWSTFWASITSTWVFSWTPTSTWSYNFEIVANDQVWWISSSQFSISVLPSNVATLSSLSYSWITIPSFSPSVVVYNITLPYGTTVPPTLSATPSEAHASLTINDTWLLPWNSTVVVTAQDWVTNTIYMVKFTVAPTPSNDATLATLGISAWYLSWAFAPSTTNYIAVLPYWTTSVPTVSATKNEAHANIVINNASTLTWTTDVIVTAQDAITVKTYSITFYVLPPWTDASLSDLKSWGLTLSGFTSWTMTYNIALPYWTASAPVLSATKSDPNANFVIHDTLTTLPWSSTVTVTAQDGTTILIYTVNYSVTPARTDSSLSALNPSAWTLSPAFNTWVTTYTLNLPFWTVSVPSISYTTNDTAATWSIINASSLTWSSVIAVIAQDWVSTTNYTVNMNVLPNTQKDITSFSFTGLLVPANGVINWTWITVTVPYGTNTWSLIAIYTLSQNATASIWTGSQVSWITLNDFKSPVLYTITAQDTSTKTYTVNVVVWAVSNDASLSDIKVSWSTVGSFSSWTLAYSVQLPSWTTSVPTVSSTVNYPYANSVITPATQLPWTTNIVVTAQDWITIKTYSVSFTVAASSWGGWWWGGGGGGGWMISTSSSWITWTSTWNNSTWVTSTWTIVNFNVTNSWSITSSWSYLFSDISDSFAKDDIRSLYLSWIISWYEDKTFRPNNPITRAEFLAIVFKVFSISTDDNATTDFTDMPSDGKWMIKYVAKAKELGIASWQKIWKKLVFRPNDPISRAEALWMLIKASGLEIGDYNATDFTDIPSDALWIIKYVARAKMLWIISWQVIDWELRFRPNDPISRAEAVKIIIKTSKIK